MSITPVLATEYSQVDDTTWQFKLREGVTFHNGQPFNAYAVVFSVGALYILRLMAEGEGLAVMHPGWPPVRGRDAVLASWRDILDYFARVADRSDGGLLLDCAHLAIFQHVRGLPALAVFACIGWCAPSTAGSRSIPI